MRRIDTRHLRRELPTGWLDRAARALANVGEAEAVDRASVIARHSSVWSELKHVLHAFAHGKCWYCETYDRRSDAAVDHYRPKNRVAEDPSHPGYWWLAFDYNNYRYSCTFCNSKRKDQTTDSIGGKADHFPLLNPASRAYSRTQVPGELPALLDPVLASDALLLYFADDGDVVPRYPAVDAPDRHLKAAISIDLYHLRHSNLIEARVELWHRIKQLIDLGKAYFTSWKEGSSSAEKSFELASAQIGELLDFRSEFSGAARDIVKGFRHPEHPWIDDLL